MKPENVEILCKLRSMRTVAEEVLLLNEVAQKLVSSDPAALRHSLQALVISAEKAVKLARDCQYAASNLVRLNDAPELMNTAEIAAKVRGENHD